MTCDEVLDVTPHDAAAEHLKAPDNGRRTTP
jgi:hypothetical protein